MTTKLTDFKDALKELYDFETEMLKWYKRLHLNTEKFVYLLQRLEDLAKKVNLKL